jgi:hypothetical protein
LVSIEGEVDNKDRDNDEMDVSSLEGDLREAPRQARVVVHKRRQGGGGLIIRNHESTLLKCKGFRGGGRKGQLKELINKHRVDVFY